MKINRFGSDPCRFKYWTKSIFNLLATASTHGLAKSPSGEFECSSLTLEEPRVSIRDEDAIAEQIMEGGLQSRTPGVIMKPSL